MNETHFLSREAAGMELAGVLKSRISGDAIVLGMPNGGVLVASAVAGYLNTPLCPLFVRKLGIPGHDNLSMGAVTSQGVQWLDRGLIDRLGIAGAALQKVVHKETQELQRSEEIHANRGDYSLITGRVAVIVDDGIANNVHNILVAIEFARGWQPRQLLIAAPVISAAAVTGLADKCEGLIFLHTPDILITADYWCEPQIQMPGRA